MGPDSLDIKPVGQLTPYNPNKTSDIKPVGKLTPVGEAIVPQKQDFKAMPEYDTQEKLNEIITNIPELPGDSESKKALFKDLVLKGVKGTELSGALETLAGKHPHQEGGYKYYLNEKGIPVPLKNSERPPSGYEVASIWGSKSDAKDDSWYTDLAKTVFNILPAAAENIVDIAQTGYEAATDESSDFLKSLKNASNYLKFEKDPDIQGTFLNTEGIDEFSDLMDVKRYDVSPETIWGTTLGLLGSVGETVLVGGAAGGAMKGISGASKLSKMQAIGANYIASYATNLGETRDNAEAIGLEGRDKALYSSIVTSVVAGIDAKFGLAGKISMNNLMKEEKSDFIRKIGQTILQRKASGELTEEAMKDLASATTTGYTQLAKKWSSETVKDVLQQGGEEAAQALVQNSGEQLWDKLTDEEKKKFGTDAFSPESFGEYLREGLAGAIGGAPTAFAFNKVKEAAKQEAQSNTAYGIASKGPQAVESFKKNVDNEVKAGKLTPEEGANAIFQVESYSEYNTQLNSAKTELNDNDKRRVFELTFEKQNLTSQIPTDYEAEKLNGIAQAEIDVKKKKAKDIQDEINKIILRDEVQNKSTTTAKKTKDEVAKDIENEAELKKGEYKTPKVVEDEKRTYEEIPNDEWNKPKFFTRVKQAKFADYLDKTESKSTTGVIQQDFKDTINGHVVDTFNVTLPDGKTVRFASSMVRKPSEKEKGGFRGNTYEENLTDKDNPIGSTVGVTVKTLKDSGRKVMFVWNADKSSPKYGKHIGMVKESLRGKSNYSEADLEEMADLRMENMGEGPQVTEVTPTPEGPVTPKYTQPKVVLGQPTRDNLRTNWIERRKKELGSNYHPDYENVYNKLFGQQFDRLNPTLYAEEKTTKSNESDGGGTKVSNKEDSGESKTKEVRTSKPVSQRKIKNKERIKALKLEVFTPHSLIMQYFIGGGKISYEALKKFHKSTVEADSRMNMSDKMRKLKNAPTLDQLAHDLWESNRDVTPNAESQDYKNALEEVLLDYNSVIKMAEDLNNANVEKEQVAPKEEIISEMQKTAEKEDLTEDVDALQDAVEDSGEENAKKIATNQNAFDKWEEDTDIKYFDGDIQFQKSKELEYAESELIKAEKELSASKKAFDAKRKELDKGLIEDQEDLFGERKSTDESALFDERATVDARNEAVKPFKDRYELAQKEYKKWQDKVNSLEGTEDNQTTLFQKVSQKKQAAKDAISKAVEVLQKAMPKMKVIYDENLKVAGYVYKDTIVINPNYAGLDTPIHEYGHVLIDSIGYDSKLIQEGIKQLKSSPLWAETKKKYPELNEEMLGKEVLAEAIGREGANVFKDVTNESKFKKWLDKIFTWLKEKLGIEKNVAKKLAKQLLRGEGTAEMKGTSTHVQKQKIKEQIADLKDKSADELYEMYNQLSEAGSKSKLFTAVKKHLGYKIFTSGKNDLLTGKNANKFVEKLANTEDIGPMAIQFRALSHMSETSPELQKLSKMFDSAHFDMVQSGNKLKDKLEKLGKAVIDEKNKALGIKGTAGSLFSSDNAKYFEYLENPKATEVVDEDTDEVSFESGYWTEEQAKEKKFSKTQIDFLNFMRELQELRNEQYEKSGNSGNIDGILKVDKGVKEVFDWKKPGTYIEAFSAYLGNSHALKDSEVLFVNPKNGNKSVEKYGDIEKALIAYGNEGVLQKAKALRLMLKYNFRARRNSKEKGGQYNLSPTGKLNNKFLKPRDKSRGYSKDFYKAAFSFIEDYTHTEHMGPLVPYIDAIQTLNELGLEEHGVKKNTVEWLKSWQDAHIYKNEPAGKYGPEVDAGLRFLRGLTSKLVMSFNIPAGILNIWMGQYNAWRAEGWDKWKNGQLRLLGGAKRGEGVVKKSVSLKAQNIIDKYQVVSQDYESNPKVSAGRLFDDIAFGMTRIGEYYIQGSMFLGQMTDAEWNMFDENGELKSSVTKEQEKELKDKLITYKNRVSDVQGKYSSKDRRNFMNSELGKSILQFKVWIPDFFEERFRREYINENGEVKKGSYRDMTLPALKQLGDYIKKEGLSGVMGKKAADMPPEAKNFMKNLKGALFLAGLYSLQLGGSDDEKKRRKGDLLSQMMSNVLFIFDPQSLKFTVTNQMASIGTLGKFIDAFTAIASGEEYKSDTRFGNKGDSKAFEKITNLVPYRKLFINDITFPKK